MMKRIIFTLLGLFGVVNITTAQCSINAIATQNTIVCGESVVLSAFGSSTGSLVLDEDFNTGGYGPGWSSTPGSTNFSNPCSPGGVDGTPHAWMDNNTSVPRAITSSPYDLSAATAGVTVCFDLMFATQGDPAPCEGPDEPDEGVFLQYSTDGGATWVDITYFDPNGGNDPQLTTWNNYCFSLPPAAITGNTMIQWFQSADSGADYDHWGIDNVQIFMNDINSEIVWQHDGYSYGVGSGGGDNPTPVTPTSTTTYTVEMTTGTGAVCTQDITITVTSPTFNVNLITPPSICPGDCASISGTAQIIQDPGGIETYENNEFELVASGSAGVNINVQGINTNSIYSGLIQNIVINGFDFSGSFICTNFGGCPCGTGSVGFGASCDLDPSSFTVTLTAPGGCTIILAPAGVAGGNYSNTTFVPVGGTAFSAPFPNGGTWDPQEPFSNLNGCDPNGVWTLSFDAPGIGIGLGTLTGWSITFDDPAIYQPVCTTWNPTADLTTPASINTDACPLVSTDYTLTVSNCVPGCPTYDEVVSIVVGACGCTPPNIIISPLQACSPLTVDLSSAIGAGSDPATLTYYSNQVDAQNATNPIGSTAGVSGSYWVRAEDPADPSCFMEYEIIVTIDNLSYSASLTDESCGAGDGQVGLTANSGVGPYTFSIDGGTTTQGTGTFIGLTAGTFNIQVVDNTTGCSVTGTENLVNIGGPTIDNITPTDPSCPTVCDGTITVTVSGGTPPYTYQWYDGAGNPVGTNAATINGLCADNYSVDVTDNAGGTTQLFYDDFETGAAGWNLTSVQGAEGADPNFFAVNDNEGGIAAGGCGIATNGDATLHITSVFNPTGGAAYDAGGLCGFLFCPLTNRQAETPLINTIGQTGLTLNFDFIAGGDIPNDQGTVWYNDGGGWTQLGAPLFSGTGACAPQGIWTAYSSALPASCENIANLQIAIRWENNDDGAGSDPSLAINNLEIVTVNAVTCTATQNTTLIDPLPIDAAFTLTDFCAGVANSATGIATAGGTFVYNPNPGDGSTINSTTGEITNGVIGTTYSIDYTVGGACPVTSTNTVTVNGFTHNATITDETCATANGVIDLVTVGGMATFTYSIDNGTTSQAGGNFTGLSAGTYNVLITDNNGCTSTSIENVINVGGPTIDLITPTDPTCNGDCDGSITVTVSGGATPYSYQWYDNLGNPIGPDAATITGLCAGNYSVDVTDVAALCTVNAISTLNDPAIIDPTFTLTDFCEGTANAASGIVTPGGSFAFNPLPGGGETIDATTGEITNGVGGTQYFVEYTTPAGACQTSLIQTVNVNATPVPVITGAFTYCLGGNSTLDAGAGYVNYNWSTGDNTQTITILAQNGITVIVTDANGCIGTSAPVNVIETTVITTNDIIEICQGGSAIIHGNNETVANTYSQTFVSVSGCDSISNVDLIVNALPTPLITGALSYCQGGDVTLDAGGPFVTYNWSIGGSTQTITSTANTGITVTVEDLNGCFGTSTSVDVVELLPVIYDSLITICDGNSAMIFGNLETVAGIYTELNMGVNGCDSTTNITLAIDQNPVIDVMNIVEESCLGDNDGTIDVASVINGTGTYTYSWDIVPDPATSFVNNLAPGTFTVTVVDANTTCQTDSTVTLNAAAICCTVAIDTNGTVSPSCGQADGSIDAFGTLGDGNYTFSINNGAFVASGLFINLSAGNYQIVVMDGSGICTDTILVQLIDLNAPSITSSTPTDLLCNGSLDGEIDIVATGGTGVLDYQITDGVFTDNNASGQFINLAAGNYAITVTDNNGCTVTDNVVIDEPTPVLVDVINSNVDCFGTATGSITLSGNGGTGTYTYSIDNGVTFVTSGNFTNLTAQNYDVIAQDANGCQSVAQLTIITEPNQLAININATNEVCFNACDGSITWAGIDGTSPYVFTLNGNVQNISPVQNVCAGTQNYTLTDDLGCSINGTIDIVPAVEIIPGLVTIVDDGCEDFCSGEVTITSNTGVAYTLDGVTNTSGVFTDLCANSYVVTIVDANGCSTTTTVVVGTAEKAIANFSFTPNYLTTLNNEVQFFNSSSNADAYSWEITGPNGFVDNITDEEFSYTFPADTGVYTICLTAINTTGCSDVVCHSIIVREELIIYVPNAFTPDGDEFNQDFKAIISGIDIYDFDFYIFNRWGELIWESHDVDQGWDGTYKGKLVQSGMYTWKITVKDVYEDDRREFVGHVSVLK